MRRRASICQLDASCSPVFASMTASPSAPYWQESTHKCLAELDVVALTRQAWLLLLWEENYPRFVAHSSRVHSLIRCTDINAEPNDASEACEAPVTVQVDLQYDIESASSRGSESGGDDQEKFLRECISTFTS